MRGAIFENLVINQFWKNSFNSGKNLDLTFWRDSQGNEIDLIKTEGTEQTAFEIKSGRTFNPDYFKGLDKWGNLSNTPKERPNVIYCGDTPMTTSQGNVLSFPSTY